MVGTPKVLFFESSKTHHQPERGQQIPRRGKINRLSRSFPGHKKSHESIKSKGAEQLSIKKPTVPQGYISKVWTRSSCCGTTGLAVSLERWGTGSIPSPAQWFKDLALPQLRRRSQLPAGSDPWPGNSRCHWVTKKEKKKKKKYGLNKCTSEFLSWLRRNKSKQCPQGCGFHTWPHSVG